MNVIDFFRQQQYGLSFRSIHQRFHYPSFSYQLDKQYAFDDFIYNKSIPIAIELKGSDLAIASENGFVSLINADHLNSKTKFQAHKNVIFDIKWRPQHNDQLLTASGDQSLVVWDVNELCKVSNISSGHNSSIKSVSFYDANILSSGGRDGFIRIWDLRCGINHEVHSISDAHRYQLHKTKTPRRKAAAGVLRSNPSSVVTALLFSQDNFLFSAGANDGCVKLWDLRVLGSNSKFNSLNCAKRLDYCGKSLKAEGFTSLALDSKKRIYASCSDNFVYSFEHQMCNGKNESDYVKCFQGSQINNYTKISVLDEDLLVCGSKNSSACVWSIQASKLNQLNQPIYILKHGIEEVSAVKCDPLTYNIYSCDDDINLSKWVLRSNDYLRNRIDQRVFAEYECKQPEVKSICLQSHKVVVSPKTPPLTSLKSWLSGSNKQNLLKSAPNCSSTTTTSSTQMNNEEKAPIKFGNSLSLENIRLVLPKVSASIASPAKRRASSDAVCFSTSKKQRLTNDENRNIKPAADRRRKNLFSVTRR